MATSTKKSLGDSDPFGWNPPADCIVTTNRLYAWWLRKRGHGFVGSIQRPSTSMLGGHYQETHYFFRPTRK